MIPYSQSHGMMQRKWGNPCLEALRDDTLELAGKASSGPRNRPYVTDLLSVFSALAEEYFGHDILFVCLFLYHLIFLPRSSCSSWEEGDFSQRKIVLESQKTSHGRASARLGANGPPWPSCSILSSSSWLPLSQEFGLLGVGVIGNGGNSDCQQLGASWLLWAEKAYC